jgi:hypothetical protein
MAQGPGEEGQEKVQYTSCYVDSTAFCSAAAAYAHEAILSHMNMMIA